MTATNTKNELTLPLDQALFSEEIQGIILTIYQNERPPSGLAGIMDWYLQGSISHFIRKGVISGQAGECAYLPYTRRNRTFHILLAGAGESLAPGKRSSVPIQTLQVLHKNLSAIKISKLGVSRSDFGNPGTQFFSKHFKGIPLWIAP